VDWRSAIPLTLLWAFNVGATDRALIMTISDYRGPATLPGVKMDAASARKILAGIGFATDHVTTLEAPELTLAGMHKALSQFAAHTGNGDRVFVYFSGHGTSYKVEDHCEQALVSSDMKPLPAQDIFKYVADLREHASRVVLMLDSCFSGGIAETVDLAGPSRRGIDRFTTKYLTLPGQEPSCALPVNVASVQDLGTRDVKGAINLDRNYAVVAAARHDEAAFDDRQNGGVATNAVLDCLKDPDTDADRSSSVSFAELASCAQDKVNTRLPGSDVFRQHIVLTGNEGMPVNAALALAGDTTANPKATLRDVLQGADARWDIQAVASLQTLRIHQDAFQVTVTSSHPGYLYAVYVGSDNQEFLKLYPTRESEPNRLEPGAPFTIPKIWHSEGPAGVDELLVLVTATPRDLTSVFGRKLAAPRTYSSARALEDTISGCRGQSGSGCPGSQSRNLSATDASGSTGLGYGAALVTVTEVGPR
jgi:hypothetical protein